MKIKRFNESNTNTMSEKDFKHFLNIEADFVTLKEKISYLLFEYILLHPELQTDADKDDPDSYLTDGEGYIENFEISLLNPYIRISVGYIPSNNYNEPLQLSISVAQYKDFLDFCENPKEYKENPDLFKNKRKYNL